MEREVLIKKIDLLYDKIKEVGLNQDLLSSQNKFNNYCIILKSYKDRLLKIKEN